MGWGQAQVWNGARTTVPMVAPSVYSDLGDVNGGDTAPAGSPAPAIAGRLTPMVVDASPQWVRISGTAAKVGDSVDAMYEGRRTNLSGDTPATRILTAAGPGAPGFNALPEGTIEIALNGINSDGGYVHWEIRRKPPTV